MIVLFRLVWHNEVALELNDSAPDTILKITKQGDAANYLAVLQGGAADSKWGGEVPHERRSN